LKALLVSGYGFHYDIRFRYVRSILLERGFQVKMVFSDFDHLKKQKGSYKDPQIIGIKVPIYRKNISIRRLYSHIVFSCKLKKVLVGEKPDLIFADIPPNTIAGSVVWYKGKNPKCKVILDVLDLWPESFTNSRLLKIPLLVWKRIRTSALPKGDCVTLGCEYYKQFLEDSSNSIQYSTIYLCKSPLKERLKFSHEEGVLSFCYLGSINNIIDIPAIVKMLATINRKRPVRLYVIGDGEKRELLISQLKENEIDVEHLGFVLDEKTKNDVFRKCHFGINMYNDKVIVGLTMKSLDYFRVGLPTVNMNIYDTGILVQEYQSGLELSKKNWKERMDELVAINDEEWERLHENTLIMFQEKFSEAVFKKNFNEILERCGINI
jgi:glycosyltransferase involved in cell wall biosynthesis